MLGDLFFIIGLIIQIISKFTVNLLQIKKLKLICEKSFPVSGPRSMDVTGNDLLLVRTKEEAKYWIQVISRLTGDLINKLPSMCNHDHVRVNKYPQDQDYAFESCSTCDEIYAHNINTGESSSVHEGSKIHRMFGGPDGSLLLFTKDWKLFKLNWDKTQGGAESVFVQDIPPETVQFLFDLCYVECHDIFMYTVKDVKEDYEIIAVKLGNETIVWRLSGPVDGLVIKPESLTCDPEGNAYVSDRGNYRILKINSLTGEVLSILQFEERMVIYAMRWSITEPDLTLLDESKWQMSTYFVPKCGVCCPTDCARHQKLIT